MKWDAIQLDAKAKGYLIFGIDQAQTAVLTQPGPWGSAFDGYCIGLAASWISLAYMGKDFPTASDACDNPPWQATQAQNLSDAINRVDWTDGWKAATSPFQCTLSDGLRAVRNARPTADFLWSIMSQAYGCYGVTLRGSGGAHAIALRHGRDGRYHLFELKLLPRRHKGQRSLHSVCGRIPDQDGLRQEVRGEDRRCRHQAADKRRIAGRDGILGTRNADSKAS